MIHVQKTFELYERRACQAIDQPRSTQRYVGQRASIDHLGVVAGIIDEIGLVEEIDHLLGTHSQEHVSPGQALKAMILNGLGFVSAPLYLFEQFFYGKATEHLIAPGIKPEHLNDDRLGRVLDKLFEANPSRLFVDVALRAARQFGVCTESVHLDATSLHLHGHYAQTSPQSLRLIRVLSGLCPAFGDEVGWRSVRVTCSDEPNKASVSS